MKFRSSWTMALAAGVTLAAAPVAAQDTTQVATQPAPQTGAAPRTHVVKTGDTLWDLARMYLNDPFLWPEIYRLNTEVVEDPHWIYPGETLRIPGGIGAPGEIAAGVEQVGDQQQAPVTSGGGTVFSVARRQGRVADEYRKGVLGRSDRQAVRAGDYYAAPAVVRQGGYSNAGHIVDVAEQMGIASSSMADRLQLNDRVVMTAPRGGAAVPGERYLTYRMDEDLGNRGQVMVPTGIITVEKVQPNGPTIARITDSFEHVRVGNQLVPLDSFVPPASKTPTAVALGTRAKILWILGDPVIPALNQYIILSARQQDGVGLGDQFTIYRHDEDTGVDEALAVASVVKVTTGGVTALLIDQAVPGVKVGSPARMSAKMP